jgi:hypothetical protein
MCEALGSSPEPQKEKQGEKKEKVVNETKVDFFFFFSFFSKVLGFGQAGTPPLEPHPPQKVEF